MLVAWAEDRADTPEREAVMVEALHMGVQEDSIPWVLLDTWLKKHPPGLVVDAWKRYMHDIFVRMSSAAVSRLITLNEKQMTTVAKASGGHFGFGKVSKKERIIIDKLVDEMRRASDVADRAIG